MAQGQWHVNNKGNAGKCNADKQECPFGSDEHFQTKDEAVAFYEQKQQKSLFQNFAKKNRKVLYKFVATGGVMLSAVSLVGCDDSIQVNDNGDIEISVEGEGFEIDTETGEVTETPSDGGGQDTEATESSSTPENIDAVLWQGKDLQPSPEEIQEAHETLNSLIVADELNRDGDYDRDEMFGGFGSGVVEGIQARDLPNAIFGDNGKASGGYMMDPYTGERIELSAENKADIDTEHIVALKEITESERIVINTSSEAEAIKQDPQLIHEYVQQGESSLTEEEISEIEQDPEALEKYYLDTEEKKAIANSDNNLTMVSSSENRSKGSRDPGEWMPYEPAHCTYIVSAIKVKGEFSLSVDNDEESVMRDVLESKCS